MADEAGPDTVLPMPIIETFPRSRFSESVFVDRRYVGTIRRLWYFRPWQAYDVDGNPVGDPDRDSNLPVLELGLGDLRASG